MGDDCFGANHSGGSSIRHFLGELERIQDFCSAKGEVMVGLLVEFLRLYLFVWVNMTLVVLLTVLALPAYIALLLLVYYLEFRICKFVYWIWKGLRLSFQPVWAHQK